MMIIMVVIIMMMIIVIIIIITIIIVIVIIRLNVYYNDKTNNKTLKTKTTGLKPTTPQKVVC